jgi:hypothetical protein
MKLSNRNGSQGFISQIIIIAFIALSLSFYANDIASQTDLVKKQARVTINAGDTWKVTENTSLSEMIVGEGASVIAPDGYILTMTIDGVETGQKLVSTAGVNTQISPGIYRGDILLTLTQSNAVTYQGLVFPLRQGLYLNETGIVSAKSVMAAISGNKPNAYDIKDIQISSTGECFNGIYVAGGNHTVRNVKISLIGNGRNDFAGQGAAIVATGEKTRLVLDNAEINNRGVVRTAVIASGGSSLIVKNSTIKTADGILPTDYVPNADILQMRGGFPVGGSLGNCRATNLLGANTKAAYINSSISAEGWGVLSTDGCTTPKLTAINSKISITGNIGGYGTYAIGNATERFLGSEFKVAFDATSLKGGYLFYGDSTSQAVTQLNKDLDLGLTENELKAIPDKGTVITSERFGVVATGDGTVDVSGRTVFNTGETIFLNKGATVAITVDGSKGAQLNAANGVILQVMDNDSGNPYTESSAEPEKIVSWDLTSSANATTGIFSNITLSGNFYNSTGWTKAATTSGPGGLGGPAGAPSGPGGGMGGGMGAPPGGQGAPSMAQGGAPPAGRSGDAGPGGGVPGGAAGGPGGPPPGGGGPGGGGGKNMALTFDRSHITGVISASEAHHKKPVLHVNKDDYKLFGVVTNAAHAAINNGVIVALKNGSTWTVTGTSYLTSLAIETGSAIAAPAGYRLNTKVDGVEKALVAGEYKGEIRISISKI